MAMALPTLCDFNEFKIISWTQNFVELHELVSAKPMAREIGNTINAEDFIYQTETAICTFPFTDEVLHSW